MVEKITNAHVNKLLISFGLMFSYFFINMIIGTMGWFVNRGRGFTIGYMIGTFLSFALWFSHGRGISNRVLLKLD